MLPSAGYLGSTKFTSPLLTIDLPQEIAFSLNQDLSAVMAKGIASIMSGDVAQIHIMDPLLHGEISELFQG